MRNFPLSVLLSITTGRLLCKFSDMHGAAEYILGHPVWTHEFADQAVHDKLRAAVLAQHPELGEAAADGVTAENWEAWLGQQTAKFGPSRTIRPGSSRRTESPIESLERLAPGKPVVVVADR